MGARLQGPGLEASGKSSEPLLGAASQALGASNQALCASSQVSSQALRASNQAFEPLAWWPGLGASGLALADCAKDTLKSLRQEGIWFVPKEGNPLSVASLRPVELQM